MILINPHTGKPVSASNEVADRLIRAGFTEKREDPEPAKQSTKRRPRKSE